jgi:hypothetical protein
MLRDRVPRQPFAAPVDQSDGPGGHVCGPALVGRGPADLREPYHRARYPFLMRQLRNENQRSESPSE